MTTKKERKTENKNQISAEEVEPTDLMRV